MQWLVSIIYGFIVAFLTLGVITFFVQGFSGKTVGGVPILLVLLLSVAGIRFIYPGVYRRE